MKLERVFGCINHARFPETVAQFSLQAEMQRMLLSDLGYRRLYQRLEGICCAISHELWRYMDFMASPPAFEACLNSWEAARCRIRPKENLKKQIRGCYRADVEDMVSVSRVVFITEVIMVGCAAVSD